MRKIVVVAAATALLGAGCGTSPPPAPIVVKSPTPNSTVRATFRVSGTASVFEATFVVEALRDGRVLERRTVMATEGAPGRGTFATTLHASPGPLVVHAFAPSAADGSPQHQVDVHVVVRP